jgi:hypothetical protein
MPTWKILEKKALKQEPKFCIPFFCSFFLPAVPAKKKVGGAKKEAEENKKTQLNIKKKHSAVQSKLKK